MSSPQPSPAAAVAAGAGVGSSPLLVPCSWQQLQPQASAPLSADASPPRAEAAGSGAAAQHDPAAAAAATALSHLAVMVPALPAAERQQGQAGAEAAMHDCYQQGASLLQLESGCSQLASSPASAAAAAAAPPATTAMPAASPRATPAEPQRGSAGQQQQQEHTQAVTWQPPLPSLENSLLCTESSLSLERAFALASSGHAAADRPAQMVPAAAIGGSNPRSSGGLLGSGTSGGDERDGGLCQQPLPPPPPQPAADFFAAAYVAAAVAAASCLPSHPGPASSSRGAVPAAWAAPPRMLAVSVNTMDGKEAGSRQQTWEPLSAAAAPPPAPQQMRATPPSPQQAGSPLSTPSRGTVAAGAPAAAGLPLSFGSPAGMLGGLGSPLSSLRSPTLGGLGSPLACIGSPLAAPPVGGRGGGAKQRGGASLCDLDTMYSRLLSQDLDPYQDGSARAPTGVPTAAGAGASTATCTATALPPQPPPLPLALAGQSALAPVVPLPHLTMLATPRITTAAAPGEHQSPAAGGASPLPRVAAPATAQLLPAVPTPAVAASPLAAAAQAVAWPQFLLPQVALLHPNGQLFIPNLQPFTFLLPQQPQAPHQQLSPPPAPPLLTPQRQQQQEGQLERRPDQEREQHQAAEKEAAVAAEEAEVERPAKQGRVLRPSKDQQASAATQTKPENTPLPSLKRKKQQKQQGKPPLPPKRQWPASAKPTTAAAAPAAAAAADGSGSGASSSRTAAWSAGGSRSTSPSMRKRPRKPANRGAATPLLPAAAATAASTPPAPAAAASAAAAAPPPPPPPAADPAVPAGAGAGVGEGPLSRVQLLSNGTAQEAAEPAYVTFQLPTTSYGGVLGTCPVRCRFLFQKPLSASDAGKLGRMVVPRCAAAHLPECGKGGAVVDVQDKLGRQYSWRLKAWESGEGPKRTYLFEQCRPFQQAWQVQPRTTLAFYQMPSGALLVDPHPLQSYFGDE